MAEAKKAKSRSKPKAAKPTTRKAKGAHPLKVGSICVVQEGITPEGRAKIIDYLDGDHMYEVRFDRNKAAIVPRKVLPEHAAP